MPVGAAIGVGSVASAAIGASAAKSAAKTQANAANQATSVQQQMYQQTRSDLSPYNAYGQGATSSLAKLLGLDGGSAPVAAPQVGDANYGAWLAANPDVATYYNETPEAKSAFPNILDFAKSISQQQGGIRSAVPTYTAADVQNYQAPRSPQAQALEQLPGYQFTRDQGIQSIARSMGSRGQTGAQAKGIARFVTGLADSTYNSQVKNLSDAASLGENAAAGTGSIGATYGQGISNTITGAGTAAAAGTVGAANAATSAIGTGVSGLLTNKLLNNQTPAYSGIYTPATDAQVLAVT